MKLATAAVLLVLAACGDDGGAAPDAPAAMIDAAVDGSGFPTTCTGDCQATTLMAMFQSTRLLNLAYYGVTTSASGSTLHVEAYGGAQPGCPTASSPTPDYTLILGRVPIPTSAEPSTSPGNLLDFQGDLFGGDLGRAATAVTLVPVAADVCDTCTTDPDGMIALDAMLTFEGGTVSGHLYARHCDSLDSAE